MSLEIKGYIEKQKSPQREICKELRKIIFSIIPDVKEEMKWGVPTYDNNRFYIVALKDHVNLGFSLKGLSKEENGRAYGKTAPIVRIALISRDISGFENNFSKKEKTFSDGKSGRFVRR